ncbi:metal-dependent hydrolase [Aquicoccus sp. G2-2]|uniref:metal-dependent hydrolase n=1 Tax=Aquicoccus sp. G2-2 TaxID=3092120 RepID=UPI002AE075A5|nr:metal-dependent hydrolase [Aquicoccus sp. G2-2]MEA1113994.1 metal-dependent hydrolase [Aquicoccus sp. G2-2]
MKLIWIGHGSWRIESGDQVLLIDPWPSCPALPDDRRDEATKGGTHILATHGHFDHTNDIVEVSKALGAPVSGIFELANHLHSLGAKEGHAFNKGGSIDVGDMKITLVPASHSSSMQVGDRGAYMGSETGCIIEAEGHTIYHSADTTIMADMAWIADYHKPDIGILSAGGYYTMDMRAAAYAAKRYFNFKTVLPSHYRTFPALEQSVDVLRDGLPGVTVLDPDVLQAVDI